MIPLFDWPAQRPKCLKNCVNKKLELFQDILAELPFVRYALQSKVLMSTTTSRLFQYSKCDPMLMPKILLLTRIILKTFKKKREDSSCLPFVIFSMLWSWFTSLCHASFDTICSKDKNFEFHNSFPTFWGQKLKFTIHLSLFTVTIHPLLFMTLFTPNFCLFKGGCPLYSKQVFSVLSSGLLS